MINQQINLYQDRFRPKRQLVTAGQVSIMLLVIVVVMITYSFNLQSELAKAQSDNLTLKQQRDTVSAEFKAVNVELKALLADTRFDDQIDEITREIRARKRVIDFVDSNQLGQAHGFSVYLASLSRLHMENVWLNKIRLSADNVHIQGSSLKEELVPEYFNRFSDERVFAGNRFDIFRLQRDGNTEWKIDFEIASREPHDE